MSAASQIERATRVFLSYARANGRAAKEIGAGLKFAGFELLIDEEAIEEGEDWSARLAAMIVSADAVVCLLSPEFAGSKVCAWELGEAERLGKRLLPVLLAETPDAPASLSALNYVRLDGDRSFMGGLASLAEAINTNLPWVREHTRILLRAQEWENARRAEDRLLFGGEVAAARAWLDADRNDRVVVTDLQRTYIAESETALARRESEERRRLDQMAEAQRRRARAQRRFGFALAGLALVTALGIVAGVAQARHNGARRAEVLAQFARLEMNAGRYDAALRAVVAGLPSGKTWPWDVRAPQLEMVARSAAALSPTAAVLTAPQERTSATTDLSARLAMDAMAASQLAEAADRLFEGETWPPALDEIVVRSGDLAIRYQRATGALSLLRGDPALAAEVALPAHEDEVIHAAISPQRRFIATVGRNGAVHLADAFGAPVGALEGAFDLVAFSADETYLLVRDASPAGPRVVILRLANLLRLPRQGSNLTGAFVSAGGDYVLARTATASGYLFSAPDLGIFSRPVALDLPPQPGQGFHLADLKGLDAAGLLSAPAQACVSGQGGRPLPPAYAQALDWDFHDARRLMAVAADGGALVVQAGDAAELRPHTPGAISLDAKFSCDGRALTTVDAEGRRLRWDLRWLFDVAAGELRAKICRDLLDGGLDVISEREAEFFGMPKGAPVCERKHEWP